MLCYIPLVSLLCLQGSTRFGVEASQRAGLFIYIMLLRCIAETFQLSISDFCDMPKEFITNRLKRLEQK